MAKPRIVFICNECGKEHSKWAGRCSECGEWNTLEETVIDPNHNTGAFGFGRQARGATLLAGTNVPQKISDIAGNEYQRVPLALPEFTRVLGGGVVPGSLILVGGDPGIGKCASGNTRLFDPISGAYLSITEWEKQQHPVLAVDEHLRLHPTTSTHFHNQGVKPVVRVTTKLGRQLVCTTNHPLLTPEGWQPVRELVAGSPIAAPVALPYFGFQSMTEGQIKKIALNLQLNNQSADNENAVPNCIFTLPRNQLASFLNTLLGCDDFIAAGGEGGVGVIFSTTSKRLAEDVQHLLLRFGMMVTRQVEQPAYASLAEGVSSCEGTNLSYAVTPVLPQLQLMHSDVYWDEIVSIEEAGEEPVYDITVPEYANFVANDLIVHNSTLLGQVSGLLADAVGPVLYISGEESAHQIKLRMDRLGVINQPVYLLSETNLDVAIEHINTMRPKAIIVDSIQTVYLPDLTSSAGSVSQVRECAARLMQLAKGENIPIFLVGHVTKEGAIAGPRVLEHIVDTVLYLEGDRYNTFRLLRAQKNRFGSTNEVGVFEMVESGLIEVANPSEAFLSEHNTGATGTAIAVLMEGTRPILAEVQSLVTTTAFSQPRRTSNGIDLNRIHLLLAVLGKRLGVPLHTQDVFVNIVGGLKINEPAADLAIAAALASSYREQAVPRTMALIGEIGLGGELRAVSQLEKRLNEAAKLGFTHCIVPRSTRRPVQVEGIESIPVRTLVEALHVILKKVD